METIEFLRTKVDETIQMLVRYKSKEDNEGLEVWEEVAVDTLKRELEMYTSAISSLRVLENYFKPKTLETA